MPMPRFHAAVCRKANANVSRAESVRKFEILDEGSTNRTAPDGKPEIVRPKGAAALRRRHRKRDLRAKTSNRPLPKTVQILDRTTETVKQASESMRQASESVSPKVRQAFDTMQERIKKQSDELMTRCSNVRRASSATMNESDNFGNP